MAKRRAEQVLFNSVSAKRCLGSPCGFDTHLESMAAVGGVSPPSLLALFGSRCRKRPFYFEDEEEHKETIQPRKIAASDRQTCVSDGLQANSSASFQNRSSTSAKSTSSANSKKRAREDTASCKQGSSEGVTHKDENGGDEGDNFNSFQYWRVPLPELDLSLLHDQRPAEPQRRTSANDVSSDVMET